MKNSSPLGEGQGVGLVEQPIYGSTRIGTYIGKTQKFHRTLGNKLYEISNHLGNVLATITDNKIYQSGGFSTAKVISAQDYFAFGATMPSRSYQDAGYGKYRYGFNGKEDDGEGGFQDYGMRAYSQKGSVFWSVDPIAREYPHYSPYQFAGRMPIWAIDLDGLEEYKVTSWIENNKEKVIIQLIDANATHGIIINRVWLVNGGFDGINFTSTESKTRQYNGFNGDTDLQNTINNSTKIEEGELHINTLRTMNGRVLDANNVDMVQNSDGRKFRKSSYYGYERNPPTIPPNRYSFDSPPFSRQLSNSSQTTMDNFAFDIKYLGSFIQRINLFGNANISTSEDGSLLRIAIKTDIVTDMDGMGKTSVSNILLGRSQEAKRQLGLRGVQIGNVRVFTGNNYSRRVSSISYSITYADGTTR
jgi:RHS repeat-associated protein